jgi:hypothetical protein
VEIDELGGVDDQPKTNVLPSKTERRMSRQRILSMGEVEANESEEVFYSMILSEVYCRLSLIQTTK